MQHPPRVSAPSSQLVKLQVQFQGKFLLRKSGKLLAQAGQGGDGVTNPVQAKGRCRTE